MMFGMSRTNIDIDEKLIRKARKLTRLKTKREIVQKARLYGKPLNNSSAPKPAKASFVIMDPAFGKVT
jgi:Arc/MetJ family transcription regulator